MSFSYITRAQFRAQLAARLGDSSEIYWSTAELNGYIDEALQVWNCAANYFVSTGVFTTVAGTAFYDLTAELPNLLANTTTDADVITTMQYQLLEPPSPTVWLGTEQFTLADLTNALTRRRNQFLEDTGIYIGLPTELPITPASAGLVNINQSILQIRRVAWKQPDGDGNLSATAGTFTQLPRTDTFGADAQVPRWSYSAATPEYYIPYYASPLTALQLAPIPIDIGRLQLLTVDAGADLDPTAGVPLGVNDDFIPYIRYGALGDLLSTEGLANDSQRAQYCEARYREGVELGKLTFSLLQAKVNGVPIPIMSLDDFDFQISGWQNESTLPSEIAAGNSNIVALHPVPDDEYAVTATVVTNAILPTSDGDFIQVGKEFQEAVLGMAQHAASFKLGWDEFARTMSLYESMMRAAAGVNTRLAANLTNFDVLSDSGNREQQMRPAA